MSFCSLACICLALVGAFGNNAASIRLALDVKPTMAKEKFNHYQHAKQFNSATYLTSTSTIAAAQQPRGSTEVQQIQIFVPLRQTNCILAGIFQKRYTETHFLPFDRVYSYRNFSAKVQRKAFPQQMARWFSYGPRTDCDLTFIENLSTKVLMNYAIYHDAQRFSKSMVQGCILISFRSTTDQLSGVQMIIQFLVMGFGTVRQ